MASHWCKRCQRPITPAIGFDGEEIVLDSQTTIDGEFDLRWPPVDGRLQVVKGYMYSLHRCEPDPEFSGSPQELDRALAIATHSRPKAKAHQKTWWALQVVTRALLRAESAPTSEPPTSR